MTLIKFPDVSHWNGRMSLAGAPAVIAKATEGAGFTDPTWLWYAGQAHQLGIALAGYHWVNTDDLGAQAAHAHAVLGSTPTMWDAEAAGSTVARLLELTDRYRALGGVVNLCYLPRWWWRDHLGSPDLRPLAAAGLALVSSAYPAAGYTDDGPGWQPYGGVTPAQWQYSDAQPFNGLRVDFNAYRGTLDEWVAMITGDAMTPQEFLALLKDPNVAAELRRLPWAYQDPGQPSAHNIVLGQLPADVTQLRGQVAGLTTLVQQLLTAPPAPITEAQLAQLTAAVEAAAQQPAHELLARLGVAVQAEATSLAAPA
jgi:Glycosyl hydrolases family 25